MICSTDWRAVINSEPHVADLTRFWHFENESIGVWLKKCSIHVADLPLTKSCNKLASVYVIVQTLLPLASGASGGFPQ